MQGTCPNPECGAVYTLAPQNIGGQFACRKCGTALRVEADGLRYASGGPAAPAPVAPGIPAATSSRAAATKSFLNNTLGGSMKFHLNIFDIVFGVGAVLVIMFTFFPALDVLRHVRFQNEITALKNDHKRANRDIKGTVSDDVQKARDKAVLAAEDAAEDHQQSTHNAGWFYGWGTLIGFIILVVASLGWLSSDSKSRRVVAGIVLCTQLLLVFFTYMRSQGGVVQLKLF